MKLSNYLYIILFISLLTQSCRKDVDDIDVEYPNIPQIVKVLSSIHGNVVDDKGNLVSGAVVGLENESVITDENGVFQFVNENMNKNGTFITIEKEGYFKGSRRIYPSAGITSLVDIELITLEVVGEFNSDMNATINHQGVELNFPKNAIINQDGTNYNGRVNVAVAYLDPTDINTLNQMPGDLTGISSDDELVALKSLGMFATELMDENGNELNIKKGQLVDVKIPVPASLQDTAPSTIPMWHFDEVTGIWVEEGFADLVGNAYEASLAHFSFWNCDIPIDYVFMKGLILNRSLPIQGITVVISDISNNTSGYGITDENGLFCGYIPGGEALSLVVYNQCGDEVYTATIGPFDEDVILDPINLNLNLGFVTLTGSATYCDGELSEYTYMRVVQGALSSTFPMLEDGTFQGNMSYCNEEDPIVVTVYDPIQGLISGDYYFTVDGDLDVGNIELCEDAFVEHIIVEYGDVKWNIPFDENLITILNFVNENVVTGEDDTDGFIFKAILEPDPDSFLLFKFFINYVEGNSTQQGRVQPDPGGFGAEGTCTSQLITHEGKEYFFATGEIPVSYLTNLGMYDPSYTSVYFHILVENK